MAYHGVLALSAPPEVVFNTVTDPHRVTRWLPDELRVSVAGEGIFRAGFAEHGDWNHRVAVLPEQLKVQWSPVNGDGWSGSLRVLDGPAGGASVELETDEELTGLADAALAKLRSEVAENFTAG